MEAFPLIAVFTLCVSFAVLQASFEDMREAPLALEHAPVPLRPLARDAMLAGVAQETAAMDTVYAANEGLLDHELASADPLQAWLDRYLTPPAK